MTPQTQSAIRELQQTVDRLRSVSEQKKALKEKDEVEEEEVCEHCGGTGEISYDVSDGEGNMQSGVGTRKCICRIKEPDEDHDRD